ncbi:hypothetical protein Tco_1533448 [Tanacetum coccineum]
MSTQQDIYAAGSENRPPMLNKENYVPWSSRLPRYAKSRPNGKLIYNSIMNGPYVRQMIPEPAEIKQMEADDQAIQTILFGLPEDIYVIVDSCETAQEIWLRVPQMIKGSDIGIQEKKAKLFNEWERFTSTDGESIESYYHRFLKLMNDFKRNKHFPENIATDYTQLYDFLKYNQKEVDDLRAERLVKTHDPLALMANANNPFNYLMFHQDQPSSSTYMQQPLPNNNNYNPQPSFNQNYMQQPMPNPEDITDPTIAINMALVLMAKAFKLNYSTPTNNNQRISSNPRNRQIAQPDMNMGQDRQMQMVGGNGGNQFRQYVGKNVGNQNGYNAIQNVGNQNPNGNGNVVATWAEGNAIRNNGLQIRCYNCRGLAEEFDLMDAVANLDEIKEVNANCILMANLQQASTSGTHTDKALVYDSNGSAEEQYTELLEPIPEPHHVQHNDSNIISEVSSMEQDRGTVEQHSANVKETRAYHESLFHNLAAEVKKVNSVNHKMKETNAKLTTELTRYKNQEKCFEISQEKYDKLERAAKFVRDFKSLAKEADESLAKHKALEFEIERLLRAVVSQDIMSIVQSNSVVDTSNLQTELERTKERFENCIIKKENEYAKLWNDWYKKCEECKYDKISYDKAYNDMQQKIKRLQAQLGDQKGKSKDTPCVSNTLDPLSQKLEDENVELEFQVIYYAKENAHLKTTYKNLFDSISMTQDQTKTMIDSLQNKLHDTIYENAKLRAQLFDKVSEQKDTTHGTSTNTKFIKQSILGKPPSSSRPKLYSVTPLPKSKVLPKVGELNALSKPVTSNLAPSFRESIVVNNKRVLALGIFRINPFKAPRFCKQSILEKPPSSSGSKLYAITPFPKSKGLPKIDETHALSKPVTSNSIPTLQESKVVKYDNVIAPGMFRNNHFKPSREEKYVPNKVKASVRINLITVSQPYVITKKGVNSNLNSLSSKE